MNAKKTRIMYIERKGQEISGSARIGRVTYSKSGQSLYYNGRHFHKSDGFKSNYRDTETGERYWISGCKKLGGDVSIPGRWKSMMTCEMNTGLRFEGSPS
jgi:hypothetical protein